MSLSPGAPTSKDPAGWFSSPLPDDLVFVEPHPRRVQAIRNGRVVIDTERALICTAASPAQLRLPGDESVTFPGPRTGGAGICPCAVDAVDSWLRRRMLVHYPPNPYHRIDCRPTNRGLRVTVAGATLVDTVR
jgi:uncharacterized protein (DUF427 family)